MDYSIPDLARKEKLRILCEGVLLCLAVNYLFYESPWAFLPLLPVPYLYLRSRERGRADKRRQALNLDFKDALNSLSVSVQAGYSLENAVFACRHDLERLYPPERDICREFRYFESQIRLSVPAEELFLELGSRSGVEDIRNFAEVLSAAKRTGGDTGRILQECARMVGDKIDVQKEIESSIAAKRMEQTVMSIMPAAIIVYLKITSPGFLDILYGNIPGAFVMTVCLAVYYGAWRLGKRILEAGYGFTRADLSGDRGDRGPGKKGPHPGKRLKGVPALSRGGSHREPAGAPSHGRRPPGTGGGRAVS